MTNPPTDERGVTDAMVEAAKSGWMDVIGRYGLDGTSFDQRMRAALEAALSHQGDVVAVDALQGLCDEWENMKVPHSASSYELGMFDGYRGAHSDLSALISKAEKV